MKRLSRLDGLRGVLAVYVMVGHALPFTRAPGCVGALFRHGEAAVDLFFCLSGLVVINSLERFEYRPWAFLRARARRLLPVYFTVLGFAVVMVWLGSPLPEMGWVAPGSAAAMMSWGDGLPGLFAWHLLAHLTLTQGVLPQGVLPYAWVSLLGPAWSLSTEWQFYAVMALVVPFVRDLRVFVLGMLAVGVGFHAVAPVLPGAWQFSRAFLPDAAPYFALGLASAVWLRGGGVWLLAGVLMVCCAVGLASGTPSKAVTPLVWAAVLVVRGDGRWWGIAGFLESRALRYLGAISYPLYLLNEPVQRACAMVVAPWAHGDLAAFTLVWLPLAVAAPMLAAMLVHHRIEMPGMAPVVDRDRRRRGPGGLARRA